VKGKLGGAVRAFGHFWWDFLIGDTPEFAVAVGVIIALAYLLDHRRLAATIVLPLVTGIFLAASTYRGRRRAALPSPSETPAILTPPPPPPPTRAPAAPGDSEAPPP
jgi:hypothetical protein